MEKKDWKKIVADSNGKSLFLPVRFMDDAKKWNKFRFEFQKELNKQAQKEIELQIEANNLFYDIRKYLSENGYEDIWMKGIGFNDAAIKEGEFIVNIIEEK